MVAGGGGGGSGRDGSGWSRLTPPQTDEYR